MKIEKPPLDIPSLLLEGDEPSTPSSAKTERLPIAGPVLDELSLALVESQDTKGAAPEPPHQGAAAPGPEIPPIAPSGSNEEVSPPPAVSSPGSEDLSESYGTGRIFLMPRDPHWLYAYWDLSPEQQSACNRLSAGNQFHVRVQPEIAGAPATEIPVHPESRHGFFHVDQAATAYSAQLGYYKPGGQWETVASSPPAVTPSETLSQDDAVQFTSVDFGSSEASTHTQFTTATRILEPIQPHHVGWLPALAAPDSPGFPGKSGPSSTVGQKVSLHLETPDLESSKVASFWTPEKEAKLVEQLGALANHQTREFAALLESLAAKGTPSVSSPLEDLQPKSQDFWFHVNAELVIFGATEADASVTIGRQPVQLRDDGTFSLRIALPDGQHVLPVVAISARGQSRQAHLQFSRFTQLDGDTR